MNLFMGYIKFIYWRCQQKSFFIIFCCDYTIYKKTLMGLWMQEKMEEDDGSSYAINFFILVICKSNNFFTFCS